MICWGSFALGVLALAIILAAVAWLSYKAVTNDSFPRF